jgi:ATP-binding protein involved in chromosome partitioning
VSLNSEKVLKALSVIIDPDFNKNIVELGFIKNLEISESGKVAFDIELTTPACPVKEKFEKDAHAAVAALEGVSEVQVKMTANTRRSTTKLSDNSLSGDIRNIIGVASGKGGVGKSTVTANLALTLALSGAKVGVLDADIYGPSMVMMLGISKGPEILEDKTLVPVEVMGGIRVVSMAMFAEDDKATIWRGPMASQMIQNFIHRVHWGELDYLLIDFPPGTGDIQLTLTQSCPISGAVVVTTPQEVSLIDARKGLKMFDSVSVPVLGIIENMSGFICDSCGKEHAIFSQGGGERTAKNLGLPYLGAIPLDGAMTASGDAGKPLVYSNPNSPASQILLEISGKIASQLAVFTLDKAPALGHFNKKWEELELEDAVAPIGNSESFITPSRIVRTPESKLQIFWTSGGNVLLDLKELRLACPCASCVDEWSGEKILSPDSVPKDIRIGSLTSIGRYAMVIHWSDGHNTGIYSWDYLRKLNG